MTPKNLYGFNTLDRLIRFTLADVMAWLFPSGSDTTTDLNARDLTSNRNLHVGTAFSVLSGTGVTHAQQLTVFGSPNGGMAQVEIQTVDGFQTTALQNWRDHDGDVTCSVMADGSVISTALGEFRRLRPTLFGPVVMTGDLSLSAGLAGAEYHYDPGDADRNLGLWSDAATGDVVRIAHAGTANLITVTPTMPPVVMAPGDVFDFAYTARGWLAVPVHHSQYFPPQPGTVYSSLNGVGPFPGFTAQLSKWVRDTIVPRRLANVPSERALTHYFAQSGSDATGDGSRANPWKSNAWANGLLTRSMSNSNQSMSGADASDLRMHGKDFCVSLWFKSASPGFFVTLFGKDAVSSGDIGQCDEWGIKQWSDGRPYFVMATAEPPSSGQSIYALEPTINVSDGQWHLLIGGYSSSQGELYISIDGTAPTTVNYASSGIAPRSGTAPLTSIGGAIPGGSFMQQVMVFATASGGGGDLGLDPTFRAHVYNGGKLRRYEELAPSYRAKLVEVWKLNTLTTPTTTPSTLGHAALTGGDTIVLGAGVPDPAGGLRLAFKRGDKVVDSVVPVAARDDVTIGDWGVGVEPILDRFDHVFTSGWANGGGNLWSRSEARAVGWVRETTDVVIPFRNIYIQQDSSAHVAATPHSFYWSGGTLYLNPGVGVDPNVVAGGFCACPNDGASCGTNGTTDNVRFENVTMFGMGLTNDNVSNYGLILASDATRDLLEFVAVNVGQYYTGYHAFGHITNNNANGRTSIATFVGCKGGLCSVRGNDMGVFVSYADIGLEEAIFLDCVVDYGALPSYLWAAVDPNAGTPGTSFIAHSSGTPGPRLLVVQGALMPTDKQWHPGVGLFVPTFGSRGDVQAAYWS